MLLSIEAAIPHNAMIIDVIAAGYLARCTDGQGPDIVGLEVHALQLSEEVGCPRCGEQVRLQLARIRASSGDLAGAHELLDGWSRRDAAPTVHQWFNWANALVLGLEGDTDRALAIIATLDDELAGGEAELDRLWLRLDRAAVLARTDKDAAIRALQDLASHGELLGATNVVAVAHRGMRALGARPWRRSRQSKLELSERERAVADLLATGATNPEIAQVLFLSRKTVERHVSNVIAKLGVRNRAEVAAQHSKAAALAADPR
jgi:DNA-binding CsgD family transcriptional regulator